MGGSRGRATHRNVHVGNLSAHMLAVVVGSLAQNGVAHALRAPCEQRVCETLHGSIGGLWRGAALARAARHNAAAQLSSAVRSGSVPAASIALSPRCTSAPAVWLMSRL